MVAGENRTHDPKPMFCSRRLLVKVLVCWATGKRFNQSPTPTQNILCHKQNNTHGLRSRGGVGCDPKQSGASPLAALLLSNKHDVRKSVQVKLLRVATAATTYAQGEEEVETSKLRKLAGKVTDAYTWYMSNWGSRFALRSLRQGGVLYGTAR